MVGFLFVCGGVDGVCTFARDRYCFVVLGGLELASILLLLRPKG